MRATVMDGVNDVRIENVPDRVLTTTGRKPPVAFLARSPAGANLGNRPREPALSRTTLVSDHPRALSPKIAVKAR
jgi:hypothetical protein